MQQKHSTSRWAEGFNKGEYMLEDLSNILFFYSKQVVGHNIDMKGERLNRVVEELDRLDEMVRQARIKKSRWSANAYSYDELVEILVNYHKEVYGARLQVKEVPIEKVLAALDALDAIVFSHPTKLLN